MRKIGFLAIALLCMVSIPSDAKKVKTLKSTVGKYFDIGAAVNVDIVSGADKKGQDIVIKHFNSVVAENCMKGEVIHPTEDSYDWTDADRIADFAASNGIALVGHCLVWHSQPPKWMFTDEKGDTVSRETLIQRMRRHIFDVAGRYRGKVKGWDVVNEAILDDGTMRPSPYYKIIGPDYIEIAFRFAQEADPDAELYINDFSMAKPGKRATYCRLLRELKAKGLRVDAIGMQSHNGVDYPDLKEYEASIDSFAACGVKAMITELDLNMLPNPQNFGGAEISQNFEYKKEMNPYADGITAEGQRIFNERYKAFFDIYWRHRHQISRVTLWGVNDTSSWLNDWPIKGRTNYPMLFDRDYKAKDIVNWIMKRFK